MKAKEEYEIRQKMSDMHENFISRMSEAYDNHWYVESVWYCYAIFEQRVNRLIAKYIDRCQLCPERVDNKSAAISTRIACLKKLSNMNYGAFDIFDSDLLDRVQRWCNDRNELVHGLVSLKHYKHYDEEFKQLAERGVPLVFEVYDMCTDFRNHWYESEEPTEKFPVKKCKCKKAKCMNPNIL